MNKEIEQVSGEESGESESTAAAAAFALARGDEPVVVQEIAEEPKLIAGKTEAEIEALLGEIPSMRENYRKQIDNLAGNYGKLNSAFQKLQQETPSGVAVEITDEDLGDMLDEFPEIAAMNKTILNNVVKKLNLRGTSSTPALDENTVNSLVSERVASERVAIHIDLLDGNFPGWEELTGLPDENGVIPETDYRKWLATQSDDYRNRIESSNNAFVIGSSIKAFQESQSAISKKREQNNQRLKNAVRPEGQSAARGVLSEQQAADLAFNTRRQR